MTTSRWASTAFLPCGWPFLNVLHVNFLVGGQLLDAAARLVLLAAVKPLFCTNAARGLQCFWRCCGCPPAGRSSRCAYIATTSTPPWAAGAGGLGGVLPFCPAGQKKAVPYYVVAGAALAAAWLCHEDNALLLPFFVGCAAAVYLVFLFTSNGRAKAPAGAAFDPLALWAGGITAWKAMNHRYYGRFIVSDFSQGEFATPWAP